MRGYLLLIKNDSVTQMHGLAVHVKKGLYGFYPKKTLRILVNVFLWFYLIQCLTSFSAVDYYLFLCIQSLMVFHVTSMKLS